jgi:hypothetical protein
MISKEIPQGSSGTCIMVLPSSLNVCRFDFLTNFDHSSYLKKIESYEKNQI